MWVFGYGSLVWKIDFPHVARVPGYIKGYARRFWQGSIDHRGTPEHPGRVVTLVNYDEWQQFKSLDPHSHTPDGTCWGLAIKVPDDQVEFVRAHLDHREKNGYETFTVDVYNPSLSLARNRDSSNTTTTYSENEPVVKGALLYVATSENRSFLGPVPIPRLAQHILRSEGPSGRNVDYFLGLVHAMRALVEYRDMDPHLRDLAAEVERVLTLGGAKEDGSLRLEVEGGEVDVGDGSVVKVPTPRHGAVSLEVVDELSSLRNDLDSLLQWIEK